MIGALVQVVTLVGMTHGLRVLGRRLGPQRGGLLMGVPSTTALLLVGCGLERGTDEAALAAEACLAGLVAAAALPLAYARAAASGWRAPAAAGGAVAVYTAVTAVLWWLPENGPYACVVVAALGLAAVCRMADLVVGPAARAGTVARSALPVGRSLAYRTAVPTGSFLFVRAIRSVAGAGCAGRFITFPGASLSVLVTTQLEAGPGAAGRLAAAMPMGSLGTLAFLTTFRFGCPWLGLFGAAALGFAAALAALAAIGSSFGPTHRKPAADGCRVQGRLPRSDPPVVGPGLPGFLADLGRRPLRSGRGFSPRLEILA